jgi:hypothetical protein
VPAKNAKLDMYVLLKSKQNFSVVPDRAVKFVWELILLSLPLSSSLFLFLSFSLSLSLPLSPFRGENRPNAPLIRGSIKGELYLGTKVMTLRGKFSQGWKIINSYRPLLSAIVIPP